jgi:hypothetical protein
MAEVARLTAGQVHLRNSEIPYFASEDRSLARPRARRDLTALSEMSNAFADSSNEYSDP